MHEEQASSPTNRTAGETHDSNSQQINGLDQSTIKAVQTFEYPPDTINAPHQSWGVKRIDLCKKRIAAFNAIIRRTLTRPKLVSRNRGGGRRHPYQKRIAALNVIIKCALTRSGLEPGKRGVNRRHLSKPWFIFPSKQGLGGKCCP